MVMLFLFGVLPYLVGTDHSSIPEGGLQLKLSHEINDLRIDLVRQEETSMVDDITTTNKVDYHPVGFDLGYGLFLDLNDNLSFRSDYLLKVQGKDYQIQEIKGQKLDRLKRRFSQSGVEVCQQKKINSGDHFKKCKRLKRGNHLNEIQVFEKNKLRYGVVTEGTGDYTFGKGGSLARGVIKIKKTTDGFSVKRKGKRPKMYQQDNRTLLLGRKFKVIIHKSQNEISVFRPGKKKDKLIKTIKIEDNGLEVFSPKKSILKINQEMNRIRVVSNKDVKYQLSLVDKK